MKKKFGFSAEINEAETIKSNPKNEYLEEEKRLLDLNIKELASLNDNVHEMSVNLEKSRTLRFYYAVIAVWQQDPQQFVQIDRLFHALLLQVHRTQQYERRKMVEQ